MERDITMTNDAWRPIATAPRDGTPHDIWVPNKGGGTRHTDVVYVPPEDCPEGVGYWRMSGDDWFVTALDEDYPPTHWMPRPPPPQEGEP